MPSAALARRIGQAIRQDMVLYYSAAASTKRGDHISVIPAASVEPKRGFSTSSGLPRLPAPDPIKTLKHFTDFAEAIESPKEHRETLKVVQQFADAEMPQLQQLLEERAKKHVNWLTPWWLNVAYLESRDPLPVITSPGVLFPKFEYDGEEGQIDQAAKLTQAVLFFYKQIQKNALKQEMSGKSPLDMSQYRFLFGTVRIPQLERDEIRYGCDAKQPVQHIAVFRNGNIFRMDVLDTNGDPLSVDVLTKQFNEIAIASSSGVTEAPLSLMTADKRDNWAKVRESVRRLPANAKKMDEVESALFTIALDESSFPQTGFTEKDEQARQALHGGGSHSNSKNRWFDKTLQFVIGSNGYCGMCYEHTPAEGPPVAALMDYVMDQFDGNTFVSGGSNKPTQPVARLDFELTEDHKKAINKAKKRINRVAEDLEVLAYTFTRFGKGFAKSMKVSPDSFIQTAFALAFYRIHGAMGPTYETASLRKFQDGRTENTRNPNSQVARFVQMVAEGTRPFVEVHDQLQAAINTHKNYTNDCMNASGMDRHLLAWKLLAKENGLPLPSLLTSPAYERLMHFQVSTSQVPTRHFIQMCFGPSADDCYGICYNPQEKEFHFTITTFKHFPSTSSKRFAKELEKALNDLRAILVKGAKERSKL